MYIIFVCLYFFFFFCLFYFCHGFRLSIQTQTHTCHPGCCTCFAYPGFLFKQDLQINISQPAKNTQCRQCCLSRKRSRDIDLEGQRRPGVTCLPPSSVPGSTEKMSFGNKSYPDNRYIWFPDIFFPQNSPQERNTDLFPLSSVCIRQL